mmetsp:Transcript_29561/g.61664  ORF Transcript_29561/g.61664 Transcript_29561/m.61664 type:complete len:237 (-) Transcript_29561:67-777(-)
MDFERIAPNEDRRRSAQSHGAGCTSRARAPTTPETTYIPRTFFFFRARSDVAECGARGVRPSVVEKDARSANLVSESARGFPVEAMSSVRECRRRHVGDGGRGRRERRGWSVALACVVVVVVVFQIFRFVTKGHGRESHAAFLPPRLEATTSVLLAVFQFGRIASKYNILPILHLRRLPLSLRMLPLILQRLLRLHPPLRRLDARPRRVDRVMSRETRARRRVQSVRGDDEVISRR